MTTRHRGAAGGPPIADGPLVPAVEPLPDLPDLLGLSLAELRRLDHPVLSAVLDELRARVVRPGETLWDFNQSIAGDLDP
jgi:FXSXX-COOH protein